VRTFAQFALAVSVAAALLAGCGGSPPIGAPVTMPQISPIRFMPGTHEKNDVVGV
jgi:hypothetical protein